MSQTAAVHVSKGESIDYTRPVPWPRGMSSSAGSSWASPHAPSRQRAGGAGGDGRLRRPQGQLRHHRRRGGPLLGCRRQSGRRHRRLRGHDHHGHGQHLRRLVAGGGGSGRRHGSDAPAGASTTPPASAWTTSADVGTVAHTAGRIIVADGTKYEEVAVSGPLNLSSAGLVSVDSATVAAAGSAQGDAAALADGFSLVSGADGTKGVKLPAAAAGRAVHRPRTTPTRS